MGTASRYLAVGAVTAGICLGGVSTALAQDSCAYVPAPCEQPTQVLPTTETRTETGQTRTGPAGTNVLGTEQTRTGQTAVNARTTPAQTLPFTGGEIAVGLLVGVGAVGTGAALVVAARRRPGLSH
jgi:hypothetical protein